LYQFAELPTIHEMQFKTLTDSYPQMLLHKNWDRSSSPVLSSITVLAQSWYLVL